MNRFVKKNCDVNMLSPLNLAFVGDTVFDLFVRETLVCQANRPVSKLHQKATKLVKASSQARAVERIKDRLTVEEQNVIRRGRNAHTNHKAKNMTEADYHTATGLEALFGYLYLKGETDRLREIFDMITEQEEEE